MNEIVREILKLKEERNAIILSHNYQRPEIQDVADYLGDSLGLARKGAESTADVIVLCGVKFMAETVSILSPGRKVLMPDLEAGCPMANMITAANVRNLRLTHPSAPCVAYVNTSAEVKAEVDICCTSANAVEVVNSVEADEVLFVPDKYLGQYVQAKTDKKLILWNGFCPTHVRIQPEDILRQKKAHPEAKVMVHPECTPYVTASADAVLSTGKMLEYAQKCSSKEFIVGTEVGLIYQLTKQNPEKKFYPASDQAVCPNMKKTTLPKLLSCLKNTENEIKVPQDIRRKAALSIERMLEI
ncbi:MAG: quinolinate synthase NadA [Candidatus Altiarchaeia archaeon]|jgi:quinolinate synthase